MIQMAIITSFSLAIIFLAFIIHLGALWTMARVALRPQISHALRVNENRCIMALCPVQHRENSLLAYPKKEALSVFYGIGHLCEMPLFYHEVVNAPLMKFV
jgi:hypothetical protein